MNKLEFLHWLQGYENSLGRWKVNMLKEETGQYIMGCFKNSNNEYVVYENDEHNHNIVFTTTNQSEAYNELRDMIIFEVRNNKGYI